MLSEKNNHFLKFFIIFILFIIVFLGFYYLYKNHDFKSYNQVGEACINDICIELEIVKTDKEREKGLMYIDYLPQNQGMLFIFEDEDKHAFWMKNTFISLDIIWINKDYEIVDIISANPCTDLECEIYKPRGEALYVIEVNKNFARENNIFIGNKVDLNY
ncbi:MAG: DUF192 domain-containing protein [Candidatus Woesearchaeota archaeon]